MCAGLDPKWRRIRFLDAANMASGFGGTGSLRTHPNDIYDGYLEGDYDAWYTAPTHAQKVAQIRAHLRPYPWEPGTVVRYRDQDFYLLGAAIDAFLKSMRGPAADLWDMLEAEVFAPIGIAHAPAVRTQEADGREGAVWLNAGYYPTLDDLAKIALLYQAGGAHDGVQILNRQLTLDLLAARDALREDGDQSVSAPRPRIRHRTPSSIRWGFTSSPSWARPGSCSTCRRCRAPARKRGDPVSEPGDLDRDGQRGRAAGRRTRPHRRGSADAARGAAARAVLSMDHHAPTSRGPGQARRRQSDPSASAPGGHQSVRAHGGAVGRSARGHPRDLAAHPRGARNGSDVGARARAARGGGRRRWTAATHNVRLDRGLVETALAQRARLLCAHAAQSRPIAIILGAQSPQFRAGRGSAQRPRLRARPPPGKLPRLLRLHPPRAVFQRHPSDRQPGVRPDRAAGEHPSSRHLSGQPRVFGQGLSTARPSAPGARSTAFG